MNKNIIYQTIVSLILICGTFSSCIKEPFEAMQVKGKFSFKLKAKDVKETQTRSSAHENDIDGVYLIVFDDSDIFLECQRAFNVSGESYVAALTPQITGVSIYAVANVASLVEAEMSGWVVGTTDYTTIINNLLTSHLNSSVGAITSMPELPPMVCLNPILVDKIDPSMNIAEPFEMERATAKITISVSDTVSPADFIVLGANLHNVPTSSYVFSGQPTNNILAIPRANYAGSNGKMISTATISDPLYCYETPVHTNAALNSFVIIKSNRGYYRIDLINKVGEQLSLQRNYYYKINISKVLSDGTATEAEAVNNPPINAEIVVEDPYSHEIISNGVDYIGLSNSEFIIYDSHAINEFNSSAIDAYFGGRNYDTINGYVATVLTYKSGTAGTVSCTSCTTESGGTATSGITFRDHPAGVWDTKPLPDDWYGWGNIVSSLTLPATTGNLITKRIIVKIPHDMTAGKIKIKLGSLEKEINIARHQIIPFIGKTIDMGSGFSLAKADFEKSGVPKWRDFNLVPDFIGSYEDMISFSSTEQGSGAKNIDINPTDNLYVKVAPAGNNVNIMYAYYPMNTMTVSEFYLTRSANQARVKVHLVREPFMDGAKDTHGVGSPSMNYCAAFWKNDEKGERIITVPIVSQSVFWSARVIYGEDFIRLAHLDLNRTTGFGSSAVTSGNPEDYSVDNSGEWKSYVETPYVEGFSASTNAITYPRFRIALTSANPDPSKPRYGLVVFMVPYSGGSGGMGQTFLIHIRQGETPDYIFSKTDTYNGSPRSFSQAFSPYNVTVSDIAGNPGGPNYSDHKSMNGRGVFTAYPSQKGYLYQWGSDIAIHPSNPLSYNPISGYAYDYNAPYKNVCPEGYTIPVNDDKNSAYNHSFVDPTLLRSSNIGLCADGYSDRGNGGSGGEASYRGKVFYNTQTHANIFMPDPNSRTGVSSPFIAYWTIDPSQFGRTTQRVLGSGTLFDRKDALSVRCVKEDPALGGNQGGGVATPNGSDYTPWE